MEKVLIVDDEQDIREQLQRIIIKEGFEVLTACNGREGLEIFQQERPRLIITDIAMPEMNGIDLLRRVKKISPVTEVIVVTGHGDYDTSIEVLRESALDYIRKPIDLEKLLVAIGRFQEKIDWLQEEEPRPNILLLDDDDDAREGFARFLRKEGFKVHEGANGVEGLRIYSENKIDVVVSDIQMPEKDGITFMYEAREILGDAEVILITGFGNEEVVVKAMHEGANNFLRKPVDIEHLIIAVEKAYATVCLKRSLAHRTRDLELSQKLMAKLTGQGEIIIDLRDLGENQGKEIGQKLFDMAVLPIVTIDREMQLVYANKHFKNIFGEDFTKVPDLWEDRMTHLGIPGVSFENFHKQVVELFADRADQLEIMPVSQYAYIIFSKVTVLIDDRVLDLVSAIFRGERK